MKKQLSVFNLMATSSIYKITALLGIMGIIEFFLFRRAMLAGPDPGTGTFHIEYVFDHSLAFWIFSIALVILTVLLCLTGYETSSKQGYTLMRLSISEKNVFILQALYNTLCYFLLWSIQLLIVFILGFYFVKNAPEEYVTNQTLFLAFYRNDFLHALLPFEDIAIWAKNLVTFLAFGICSSGFTYAQRRGKRGFELLLLLGAAIIFFAAPLGEYQRTIFSIVIQLFCIVVTLVRILTKEESNGN